MKKAYVDDSEFTEIIIQPDGRVYVFGLTPQVAEALTVLKTAAGGGDSSEPPVMSPVKVYTATGEPHGEG